MSIENYQLLLVHSINMIVSIKTKEYVTYYELYENFDKMGVFNFMETSFIISLGITFVLILLLIYHFKQRLTASESKQDTMFEIINNLAQELNNVKGHLGQLTMMTRPSTPYPFNTANSNITFSHEKVAQNDEPDEESMEDDDYESDDEERIIVSDDDDEDDISVEELSDDDEEISMSVIIFELIDQSDDDIGKSEYNRNISVLSWKLPPVKIS